MSTIRTTNFRRRAPGLTAIVAGGAVLSLGAASVMASTTPPSTEPPTPPVAVTRMTFQAGAQAPWHTHNGPVIVSVVEGELTYVMADDCSMHTYAAGSAFVDPGHGNVHSGYNATDGLTVVVNTFLEAPADGPLSITEGVTAPADNCAIPTSE